MGTCCWGSDTYAQPPMSIYDVTAKDIDGRPMSMGELKGKVLLIVNVAGKWGMTTRNYKELVQLHKQYRDQGFEILGFPCAQFLNQEHPSNEEIKRLSVERFGVEFKMFSKVNVNGGDAHPLFQYLRTNSTLRGGRIRWNFGKFLVTRTGEVQLYASPSTNPFELRSEIEKLLQ